MRSSIPLGRARELIAEALRGFDPAEDPARTILARVDGIVEISPCSTGQPAS